MSTLLASPRQIPVSSEGVGKRIPTLDGWRGVAILLVLFDHIQHSVLNGYAKPWLQVGGHGVTIFLVLSGFLITTELSEGLIDLRRFYLRRFFRLMPVAWTFLVFLLLFQRLTGVSFTSLPEVRGSLFFYRNFQGQAGGGTAGHFWSLSLEEQFYLVWPWVMMLGRRRAIIIASTGALGCALFRFLFWSQYSGFMGSRPEVRADALLIGCLLALLLPRIRPIEARWLGTLALPSLLIFLSCIIRFHDLAPLHESLAIACLFTATMLHQESLLGRCLSAPWLAYIGTISYSLYVWQEFFMSRWSGTTQIVLFCTAMPLFALASYYWIERPCTAFGRRLS
jgi:peptidoglycan/LPS O-acetylase OafA/YrhL